MGAHGVVFVGEGGDVCGEVDAVGDVLSIEALVLQCLEPALDDAVGVRGSVPGAHVGEVCPGGFGERDSPTPVDTSRGINYRTGSPPILASRPDDPRRGSLAGRPAL